MESKAQVFIVIIPEKIPNSARCISYRPFFLTYTDTLFFLFTEVLSYYPHCFITFFHDNILWTFLLIINAYYYFEWLHCISHVYITYWASLCWCLFKSIPIFQRHKQWGVSVLMHCPIFFLKFFFCNKTAFYFFIFF